MPFFSLSQKHRRSVAPMNLYCIIFGLIFLAAGAAFFAGLTPGWLNVWQRMS